MPPISASRSAPLMSCTSPAARNESIQVRRSCFEGFGAFLAERLAASTMVCMRHSSLSGSMQSSPQPG